MPHIFISYAKKDTRPLAEALYQSLNAVPGLTAWMDKSLEADESWAYQIEQEIDRADYVVVLLSKDINRPPITGKQHRSFVMKEIAYAQRDHKTILPVMVQNTKLPVEIVDIQYIDLTATPNNPEQVVERVCRRFNISYTAVQPSRVKQAQSMPTTPPAGISAKGKAATPSKSQLTLPQPKPTSQQAVAPLRAYNPLDWLRLYWWLFFHPGKLLDHRDAYGKEQEHSTATWLTSTLALLPLFIPTLAATVGSLGWNQSANISPGTALLLIVGLWLAAAILDPFLHNWPNWAGVVAFFVAGVVTFFMAVGMAGVVAFFVAGGMAGAVAYGMGVVVASGVAVGMVGGVAVAVGMVGGVAVAVVVAGVGVGGMAGVVNRLKQGNREPHWLAVIAGLLTPVSYVALIVASFFPSVAGS